MTRSYVLNQLNNYEIDNFILDLKNNIFQENFINKSRKDVIDIISSVFTNNNLCSVAIVLESKEFGNLAIAKLVCQILQNLYLTPLLKDTGVVYGISVTPHIDANRISILFL